MSIVCGVCGKVISESCCDYGDECSICQECCNKAIESKQERRNSDAYKAVTERMEQEWNVFRNTVIAGNKIYKNTQISVEDYKEVQGVCKKVDEDGYCVSNNAIVLKFFENIPGIKIKQKRDYGTLYYIEV